MIITTIILTQVEITITRKVEIIVTAINPTTKEKNKKRRHIFSRKASFPPNGNNESEKTDDFQTNYLLSKAKSGIKDVFIRHL